MSTVALRRERAPIAPERLREFVRWTVHINGDPRPIVNECRRRFFSVGWAEKVLQAFDREMMHEPQSFFLTAKSPKELRVRAGDDPLCEDVRRQWAQARLEGKGYVLELLPQFLVPYFLVRYYLNDEREGLWLGTDPIELGEGLPNVHCFVELHERRRFTALQKTGWTSNARIVYWLRPL